LPRASGAGVDRAGHARRAHLARRAVLRGRRADVRRHAPGRAHPLRGQLPQPRGGRVTRQRRRAARRRRGQRGADPGGRAVNSQRVARLVTDVVVRRPALWRLLRGRTRGLFDRLAPTWETRIGPQLAPRVTFEVGDGSRLAFADGAFELVTLANMIPFFDELARVTAPGGAVAFSFSKGPETPIYVQSQRLRNELSRRGFLEFADFAAGPATALLARKG